MIKCGDRLYVGGAATGVATDDPHAVYEGGTGGSIQVLWAKRGEVDAEVRLPAPPVWDGMAAANNRLYVSTASGEVVWLGDE